MRDVIEGVEDITRQLGYSANQPPPPHSSHRLPSQAQPRLTLARPSGARAWGAGGGTYVSVLPLGLTGFGRLQGRLHLHPYAWGSGARGGGAEGLQRRPKIMNHKKKLYVFNIKPWMYWPAKSSFAGGRCSSWNLLGSWDSFAAQKGNGTNIFHSIAQG